MTDHSDGGSPSDGTRPRRPSRAPGASPFRVAVTRPPPRHPGTSARDRLARHLEARGLTPVPHPLLRLAPPADPDPLKQAAAWTAAWASRRSARNVHSDRVEGSTDSVWLMVTSANAVAPFLEALEAEGAGVDELRSAGLRVAAVGRATARTLEAAGLAPEVVPRRFTAEALLEALAAEGVSAGHRVIFPRADRAGETLPRGLEALGARVMRATAYRVVVDPQGAAALARAVARGELEAVTFTSGSAARALARSWREKAAGQPWPEGTMVAAIGPVTAGDAREAGLPVHLVPERASLEALADAVADAAAADAGE